MTPTKASVCKGNPQPEPGDAVLDNPTLCLLFKWNPLDLSEGGTWYNKQVHSLRAAVVTLPDLAKTFLEGPELLVIHRTNYTATGPAPMRLQLLWWEFPPEHWTPLQEGSSINFLVEPVPRLTPMQT
jgi:hypothetical protein